MSSATEIIRAAGELPAAQRHRLVIELMRTDPDIEPRYVDSAVFLYERAAQATRESRLAAKRGLRVVAGRRLDLE